MLVIYARGTNPHAFTDEWRYRLEDYADDEVLEKELDKDFPLGWTITRVEGLKYVDPRMSLYDLYQMNELLESEEHGEAFRLYVETQLDASYAFDTFWDAYQGHYEDLEDFAYSFLENVYGDFATPPGFVLEWDRISWECEYMDLEGYIFRNV